jgi:hypothetical protein
MVSPRTAAKWAQRYRAEGIAGMVDRSSRPHTCRFQNAAMGPDLRFQAANLDHFDPRVRQDRVERRRELPGAVADEEPDVGAWSPRSTEQLARRSRSQERLPGAPPNSRI